MSLVSLQKGVSSSPSAVLRAVTPHATDNLPDGPSRALYVGIGGDLSIVAARDGDAVSLKNVADGSFLPIQVKAVRSAGTTATDLVAVY